MRWRPFQAARAFVHALGLKSRADWDRYSKSGDRPSDIPSNPWYAYKESGWISLGDWLGTYRIADSYRVYRTFPEARAFVHTLGLKKKRDWIEYAKSGKKPEDIPSDPRNTY